METWFRRISVSSAALSALVGAQACTAQQDDGVLADIVAPELERPEIRDALIDSENIELGLFAGVINVEDFGSNTLYGTSAAYHISEDFFIEATYAQTELGESSFERLSGVAPLLTDDQRDLSYYNASVGWNLFQGEHFVFEDWAFNSNFYLIGGVGNTSFADEEHFTYNFGAGVRILANDWLAVHLDVRDHVFEHELFGEAQMTNNLSTQLGLTIFF
ncbi:outer membrane beta-barrel domain-containing protein [Microbulbifer sp. OS29]|uniref:Outer membrane beta-barrel domain-containing protein n=1 Tax=Microbulbifer okhotskensis TaxID=2926617 RepID=A0A9X2J393_9GAMM|nr:outer membrane beta-barrel domain-containing protein [Microbulbifer okhotskensis]MCO1332773.1 outer membrane beta-barrel domain-containing protein [Microbulbifer okhotskensis]